MFKKVLDHIWLKLYLANAKLECKKVSPMVGVPMLLWLDTANFNKMLAEGGRKAVLDATMKRLDEIQAGYRDVFQQIFGLVEEKREGENEQHSD